MYGWAVRFMIRRAVRLANEGDIEAMLGAYSDDVHFVFPGDSSWAADIHSKQELEPWLLRFAKEGPRFDLRDIAVSGWPWNTTVSIQYTGRMDDAGGNSVYENRGVR